MSTNIDFVPVKTYSRSFWWKDSIAAVEPVTVTSWHWGMYPPFTLSKSCTRPTMSMNSDSFVLSVSVRVLRLGHRVAVDFVIMTIRIRSKRLTNKRVIVVSKSMFDFRKTHWICFLFIENHHYSLE